MTMNEQAYLRPTVTQKIRGFFDQAGEKVPPWTSFDEVMDSLWSMLYSRRDDEAFWKSFENLITSISGDLYKGHLDGLPDPQAEILSEEKTGKLLDELQAAVRKSTSGPGKGVMKRFLQSLSTPLIGCLLMMGAAAATGCDEDENSASAKLNNYVDDSSLSSAAKQELKSCFDGWTEETKLNLVEVFQTMTPEQIASRLQSMIANCGECTEEYPCPVYKGVTL
jgi:hypothetical protein